MFLVQRKNSHFREATGMEINGGRPRGHNRLKSWKHLSCWKLLSASGVSCRPPGCPLFTTQKPKPTLKTFYFFWNIVDVQYYVNFKWAKSWLGICIHKEMMTISLVTSVPIQSYYRIIDHISYATYYSPVTYVSYNWYNWRFVPLHPLRLFHPTPTPLPAGNHTVCLRMFSFCFVYFDF